MVKVGTLIGKAWDPVTWDGDVWEDPVEAENFEPSGSHRFALPEGISCCPQRKMYSHPS